MNDIFRKTMIDQLVCQCFDEYHYQVKYVLICNRLTRV